MRARPSIVIPVHNRAALTRGCLEVLLSDPDCVGSEILVVDDASSDGTPEVLDSFGPSVRVLRNRRNLGFAAACNLGVEATSRELVILLNNDIRPAPGWLDGLLEYAADHRDAAVVGAKLLFPDGRVQHAGVVIGQDRNPYHLYAGFPGDHAAASRSRRFQIVTGACMLVRRSLFKAAGGFDTAFVNGHEDVDLCLRLGRQGYEVHLCASSVLYHLESASRDPQSTTARANGQLYRRRWAERVRPDDLDYYLEDGLLRFSYRSGYPTELEVSPLLATVRQDGRSGEVEELLARRSQEVIELLRESIRLTVELGEATLSAEVWRVPHPKRGDGGTAAARSPVNVGDSGEASRHRLLAEQDREIEAALGRLQAALTARTGAPIASRWLEYRGQVQELVDLVCLVTPPGAHVAVVSRGDDRLIDLPGRRGRHLPEDGDGNYAGFHPADGHAAVKSLEALHAEGVQFLAIPRSSCWWLDHYRELRYHLERTGTRLAEPRSGALLYALDDAAAACSRSQRVSA